jgi:hypothetical protein
MTHDVIIVGAGVSGLALARELQAHGLAPLVLERARGVGGRCATRRIDGQPVDHGLAFLHGRTPRFLAELDAIRDAAAVPDWPRAREGSGLPCQPKAFDGRERRLAYAEGVSRFAKHLAREVPVRLGASVATLRPTTGATSTAGRAWDLTLTSGESLRAPTVVLALPAPSALALLRQPAPPPAAIAATLPLLEMVRTLPCLTVIARYPEGTPAPAWEASFPGSSSTLHTILHDSSKRAGGARLTLVVQARPQFSRAHLDDPMESWTRALLAEAAALHGAWVAHPEIVQSHIWRNARVAAGTELAHPVVVSLDDGALLGIAGDGFHEAGGVEGAYLSGLALAQRLRGMLPDRR